MTYAALLLAFLAADPDDDPTPVPPFALTERDGSKVTKEDLRGKVWVASFILINCPDHKCPQVTRTVQRLQKDLAGRADVRLVTFIVPAPPDPKKKGDDPLNKYATAHEADPWRWLFLAGDYDQIDGLMRGLYLRGGEKKSGQIDHSQKLVVIDRHGNVAGYFDGLWNSAAQDEKDFERNLLRLRRTVDKALQREYPAWMPRDFPAFNASLNALACVLLLTGYAAIKLRLTRLHIACMLTTVGVSAVFLASYLFFHIVVKEWRPTMFADQAPDAPQSVATFYAVLLLSHTALAMIATPMALITSYLGLREKWSAHVKLARWTFPIWLYVSVTGVAVYWMLYRLYPAP